MLGCLYIVPNIKLGLLGIRSSMKTDSSLLGVCICKSSRNLYDNFCDIYMRDPPADDSVGVCSMLSRWMSMLLVREFFLEILLSEMQMMSNLVSTWLRSVFDSFMWAGNDEMFKCERESPCSFILVFLYSLMQGSHNLQHFLCDQRIYLDLSTLLGSLLYVNFLGSYSFRVSG